MVSNSAPHFASATTRRCHLTPLAGRNSGPTVNGIWGLLNLAGGLGLLKRSTDENRRTWDSNLVLFEAGAVTMAAWMAASEIWFHTNTR